MRFIKLPALFGTLFCLLCSRSVVTADKPLLAVVIMVKNEEQVLTGTLEPFVQIGVRHFLVYDTGSIDKTVERAHHFFKEKNLHDGVVIQEPFVDFATSRNRALFLAQQQFPDATFIMMPDAEWYLCNGSALMTFCAQDKDTPYNVYALKVVHAAFELFRPCLFRNNQPIAFKGKVHEYVEGVVIAVPHTIYFDYDCSQAGKKKSTERFQKDLQQLLSSYAKNPLDAQTVFHIAQTYRELGNYQEAYTYFKQCEHLSLNEESKFVVLYQIGRMIDMLKAGDATLTTAMAMEYYEKAYQQRPTRVEPLVMMAQNYVEQNKIEQAFKVLHTACNIPVPQYEHNMLEKKFYTYHRYDILAYVAWRLQEYEVGKYAVQEILKNYPADERMQKNLMVFQNTIEAVPKAIH